MAIEHNDESQWYTPDKQLPYYQESNSRVRVYVGDKNMLDQLGEEDQAKADAMVLEADFARALLTPACTISDRIAPLGVALAM
jgi:hypothetical protein